MQRRVRITYQLKDNILTRCFTNGMTNTKQIILPTNHQLKVLELSHDIPLAGYFIVNKTIHIIQQFFWPGMTKDIRLYCKSCAICQKTGKKGSVPKMLLQATTLTCIPF